MTVIPMPLVRNRIDVDCTDYGELPAVFTFDVSAEPLGRRDWEADAMLVGGTLGEGLKLDRAQALQMLGPDGVHRWEEVARDAFEQDCREQ